MSNKPYALNLVDVKEVTFLFPTQFWNEIIKIVDLQNHFVSLKILFVYLKNFYWFFFLQLHHA